MYVAAASQLLFQIKEKNGSNQVAGSILWSGTKVTIVAPHAAWGLMPQVQVLGRDKPRPDSL